MIYKKYNDFDELFFSFNKEIIENPEEYIEDLDICSGYLPFTCIEVNSYKCTLNLGDVFYTKRKFPNLIKIYINLDKLKEYKINLLNSKGTSLTYYFNQEKRNSGKMKSNGPCIISVTLTRPNRKSNWNEINIFYRTAELTRRFAADLVLFHIFIKELPNCCKIEKIRFLISKPYLSTMTASAQLEFFKIDLKKFKNHSIQKSILKQIEMAKNKTQFSKFKSRAIIQEKILGLDNYEFIDIKQLHIMEEK